MNLKRSKTSYCSVFIECNLFLKENLKRLLYGVPCRFVLHIVFVVLPVLSYGQGLHTADNVLPAIGLENVYSNHQDNIEPVLFVASNTIISKSDTTTFFVGGSIQMDMFLVAQSDIINYPTSLSKKTQIIINLATKVVTADLRKSSHQPTPYSPWNKNPLQQERYFAAAATVYVPSTLSIKKNNNNSFGLQPHCADLLPMDSKAEWCIVYFTDNITTHFEKNLTEFSSRPPPACSII